MSDGSPDTTHSIPAPGAFNHDLSDPNLVADIEAWLGDPLFPDEASARSNGIDEAWLGVPSDLDEASPTLSSIYYGAGLDYYLLSDEGCGQAVIGAEGGLPTSQDMPPAPAI